MLPVCCGKATGNRRQPASQRSAPRFLGYARTPPSTAIQAQPEGEVIATTLYVKIALRCIFPLTGGKRHCEDKFQFVDAGIARFSSPRKTESQNPAIVSFVMCVSRRVSPRRNLARGAAPTSRRVGSDDPPRPVAVGSVFWPCGVINPVPGLFVGPAGNSITLVSPAQWGRTVRIAVVRMQLDHANGTAMGPDDRLTMTCACQRERAEERKPRGKSHRRKFHDLSFVLLKQTTNGPSI